MFLLKHKDHDYPRKKFGLYIIEATEPVHFHNQRNKCNNKRTLYRNWLKAGSHWQLRGCRRLITHTPKSPSTRLFASLLTNEQHKQTKNKKTAVSQWIYTLNFHNIAHDQPFQVKNESNKDYWIKI